MPSPGAGLGRGVQPNEPMLGEPPTAAQASSSVEVLHYLGYDEDYGGIVSVVRALAATGRFRSVLGLNAGAVQRQSPPLPVAEFPPLAAEQVGARALLRSRSVARAARDWLGAKPNRVFHGHSRAGLLVALWLHAFGERRVVATVHTLGRQAALYRAAARVLGRRLFWLTPSMKRHYGLGDGDWSECLPDCIPEPDAAPQRRARSPGDRVTLGAVGPFAAYKRWDILIDALRNLPPALRERVRVLQAGAIETDSINMAHAAELRARAEAHGVSSLIEWRGRIVPLGPFWSEIDCLVVASPIEAFGVAALEALAAGVPVIASDVSGTSDLVRTCAGGWLFPGDSAHALAQRIAALAETGALGAWQPDRAALRQFFAPAVAEGYLAVYRSVLAPTAPR